ncbi:hypothetical protein bsdtw1_02704 [Clostridium fungisolvens]|uniref:Uncharacterized protein n=1 Tax=Clostridium fungisolvens TaxID=1604897 RepID=A0A6V8SIL7_9CLOT|nr:hypothetical protein bsdtw1_02704 [Clostridium fungisolvens]
MLRQLENELKNNEISAEDAWKRCLEIRDGKKSK